MDLQFVIYLLIQLLILHILAIVFIISDTLIRCSVQW